MNCDYLPAIAVAVFLVALLYSSVGHAGASGYIAVMVLFGVAPGIIKPTALILNIAVASIATWQFWRAGHFRWALFWPFAMCSIPLAFIGGWLNMPTHTFKHVIGILLLISAARFLIRPAEDDAVQPPTLPVALSTGGAVGFLAGITGTGGGILLTPIMLLLRWAGAKSTAATSALFILVNSVSGLAGNLSATRHLPWVAGVLLVAAMAGGTIGSYIGSHRLPAVAIKRLLAAVLTIAGGKLIWT